MMARVAALTILCLSAALLPAAPPVAEVPTSPQGIGSVYRVNLLGYTVAPEGGHTQDTLKGDLEVISGESGLSSLSLVCDVPSRIQALLIRADDLPHEARIGLGDLPGLYYYNFFADRSSDTVRRVRLDLLDPLGPNDTAEYRFTLPDGTPAHRLVVTAEVDLSILRDLNRSPVEIGPLVFDAEGKVRLTSPARRFGFTPGNLPKTVNFSLRLDDPETGQRQTVFEASPHYFDDHNGGPIVAEIPSLMAPLDAPPAGVFSGTVVDSQGAPVPFARLVFNSVNTGSFLMGFQFARSTTHGGPPFMIESNAQGSFRIMVPVALLELRLGHGTLPQGATIEATVMPPAERRATLTDATIRLAAGAPQQVTLTLVEGGAAAMLECTVLKPGGTPMTMEELGQEGWTLDKFDGEEGRGNFVARVGEKPEYLDEGGVGVLRFAPVEMPAWLRLTTQREVRYKPVLVSQETLAAAGGRLAWESEDRRATLTGRVTDATTRAPIVGAYVASSFVQDADWWLATLPYEEREALYANVPLDGTSILAGRSAGPAPKYIRSETEVRLLELDVLGRTDPNGRFRMEGAPGKVTRQVIVVAPSYVGASARIESLQIGGQPVDPLSTFEFPEVGLFPRAELEVVVTPPDVIPDPLLRSETPLSPESISLGFEITFDLAPSWTRNVTADQFRQIRVANSQESDTEQWHWGAQRGNQMQSLVWEPVWRASWGKFNEPSVLHVPADATLKLRADGAYGTTLGYARWPEVAPLRRGDRRTLPPQAISAAIPVAVTVRRADGTPAAGYSVTLDGNGAVITDAAGAALCWARESPVKAISVSREWTRGRPPGYLENVTIPPDAPLPFAVTITLTE